MSTYQTSVIIERFDIARKEILKEYITGLAKINQIFLKRFQVPRLYLANVRYKDESDENPFLNCLAVIKNKGADCKSLTAWRLAELWEDGVAAECHVEYYGDGLSHVLIKHPNGFIEDVSAALGMPT